MEARPYSEVVIFTADATACQERPHRWPPDNALVARRSVFPECPQSLAVPATQLQLVSRLRNGAQLRYRRVVVAMLPEIFKTTPLVRRWSVQLSSKGPAGSGFILRIGGMPSWRNTSFKGKDTPRCRLYSQPRRQALSGTLAAPAPSRPLAMAVNPVSSLFGLELPSSLLNRIAGLHTAYTTLDVQLCALAGWWHI